MTDLDHLNTLILDIKLANIELSKRGNILSSSVIDILSKENTIYNYIISCNCKEETYKVIKKCVGYTRIWEKNGKNL